MTANLLHVTSNGTWILPFWEEGHTVFDLVPDASAVLISTDQGNTWNPYGAIRSNSTWLLIVAVCRPDRHTGYREHDRHSLQRLSLSGVLTDHTSVVCDAISFSAHKLAFCSQAGPMMVVIHGVMHMPQRSPTLTRRSG